MQNNTKEAKPDAEVKRRFRIPVALRNILLGLTPIFVFLFIKPEWLARLIAVSGSLVIFTAIILFYGFNPKTDLTNPKGNWNQYPKAKRIFNWFIRGLTVLFGVAILYYKTIPILQNCYRVHKSGITCLSEREGTIQHNDILFGAYFLLHGINLSNSKGEIAYHSAFYFNRVAHEGQHYICLIAPKSGIILAWKEEPQANSNKAASMTNSIENWN